VGLAHLLVALLVLGADVEQADGGARRAVHGVVEGRAQDGELDQPLGVGADVGADVEHRRAARSVGQLATRAGRSMSADMRRISLAIAIRAPVLPPLTQAAASPVFTASTAFHMLEPLPRRMAWAGFSSAPITLSVWRISTRPASAGSLASAPSGRLVAVQQKRASRPSLTARAMAGTTTAGPWSPPMASIGDHQR
jgi:hypothetical protein